jgi:hypothetical protein
MQRQLQFLHEVNATAFLAKHGVHKLAYKKFKNYT